MQGWQTLCFLPHRDESCPRCQEMALTALPGAQPCPALPSRAGDATKQCWDGLSWAAWLCVLHRTRNRAPGVPLPRSQGGVRRCAWHCRGNGHPTLPLPAQPSSPKPHSSAWLSSCGGTQSLGRISTEAGGCASLTGAGAVAAPTSLMTKHLTPESCFLRNSEFAVSSSSSP